jgi:hypothetical protein
MNLGSCLIGVVRRTSEHRQTGRQDPLGQIMSEYELTPRVEGNLPSRCQVCRTLTIAIQPMRNTLGWTILTVSDYVLDHDTGHTQSRG